MRKFCSFLSLALVLSACQTSPPRPPTPEFPALTAYKKVVEDRLGALWYRRIQANEAPVQIGTVKVTFEVPSGGGAVTNLQLVSNTGGSVAETIARSAIAELRAPPVPRAVLEKKQEGEPLVLDESFTVFAPR